MTGSGWQLGADWYVPVAQLALPELLGGARSGCSWSIVRRAGAGPRSLLQLWDPGPPARDLDALREAFLQRFAQAEPADPGPCHLGFDEGRAWFLQELAGLWREVINSNSQYYGGTGLGNEGGRETEDVPSDGYPQSINFTLPPLCTLIFQWPGAAAPNP